MPRYLAALQIPMVLAAGGFFALPALGELLPAPLGGLVASLGRWAIIGMGGWKLVQSGVTGPWGAMWAGPLLLLVEHVLTAAVILVVVPWDDKLPLVLAATLVAYVVWAPVTLVPAWIGGFIGLGDAPAAAPPPLRRPGRAPTAAD
jgi:hypothetical protein